MADRKEKHKEKELFEWKEFLKIAVGVNKGTAIFNKGKDSETDPSSLASLLPSLRHCTKGHYIVLHFKHLTITKAILGIKATSWKKAIWCGIWCNERN